MAKRCLLTLFVTALCLQIGYGQNNTQENITAAYNSITLDISPAIISLTAPDLIKYFGGDEISGAYSFGIGLQYERSIDDSLSLAWRLDYFTLGTGLKIGFDSVNVSNIIISKITFENHFRFFPFNGNFFMGGLIGYTYLSMDLDGNATVTDPLGGIHSGDFSLIVERHSIKFGARAGWRIRFGRNIGFTLETSLGYDIGIAFSESLTDQFKKGIFGTSNFPMKGLENLEENFQLLETLIIAGGPRITFSLGWSF